MAKVSKNTNDKKTTKKVVKKATAKKVDVRASIDAILDRIANGESLRKILPAQNRPKEFPHIGTFLDWIKVDEQLAERYARAQELRAEKLFEEILEIADDTSNDTIVVERKGESFELENKEWVNRSRLRVDARKWALSKMLPKKYGDKLDLTSDGEKMTTIINLGNGVKPTDDAISSA